MKLKSILPIAIFGMALSCNSNPSLVSVVDIDDVSNSINVELSDFLKDIEVVELETTEYNLFAVEHHSIIFAYITNTSIVIRTSGAIYQFDRQGKYLRKLTEKGNGSREFISIRFCFVDEDAEILYYVDVRTQGMIHRIDLTSGQFLEPVQANMSRLDPWLCKNNSIYGFPTNRGGTFDATSPDSSVVAFQYDVSSGIMKKFYGNHKYTIQPLGKSMVEYGNYLFLFNMHYSDTLYQLQDNTLYPRFLVKMNNKMTNFTKGGDMLVLLFEYEQGIVLEKTSITYQSLSIEGELAHGLSYYPEQYLLLSLVGGLQHIAQVYINPLDITIKTETWTQHERGEGGTENIFYPFPKPSGSYGYLLVEQEEDNPHIIIGKIR